MNRYLSDTKNSSEMKFHWHWNQHQLFNSYIGFGCFSSPAIVNPMIQHANDGNLDGVKRYLAIYQKLYQESHQSIIFRKRYKERASIKTQQALREAIRNDQTHVAMYLISKDIDTFEGRRFFRVGNSQFLYLAAQKGNHTVFDRLIEKGHDPKNEINKNSYSLIHAAARSGDVSMMKKVESFGLNIHAKDRSDSNALNWAHRGERLEMLKYLINEKGFDANNTRLQKMLLSYVLYADPIKTRTAMKPLLGTCGWKHSFTFLRDDLEIIRILVNAGVDINSEDENGKTILDLSLENEEHAAAVCNFIPRYVLLASLGAKKGSGIKKKK
ncbi:MAG: ankyrin repeat domain-containing protein [Lentisphaeria bacterium]|nr:ankyrin repeat domain-containing protein [Lentisphaeria bacterium]